MDYKSTGRLIEMSEVSHQVTEACVFVWRPSHLQKGIVRMSQCLSVYACMWSSSLKPGWFFLIQSSLKTKHPSINDLRKLSNFLENRQVESRVVCPSKILNPYHLLERLFTRMLLIHSGVSLTSTNVQNSKWLVKRFDDDVKASTCFLTTRLCTQLQSLLLLSKIRTSTCYHIHMQSHTDGLGTERLDISGECLQINEDEKDNEGIFNYRIFFQQPFTSKEVISKKSGEWRLFNQDE